MQVAEMCQGISPHVMLLVVIYVHLPAQDVGFDRDSSSE